MGNSDSTSFLGIPASIILFIGIFATLMLFISLFVLVLELERIKANTTEPLQMKSIKIQGKLLMQRLQGGTVRVSNTFVRYISKLYRFFQITLAGLLVRRRPKRIVSNKPQSTTSGERAAGTKETPPLLPPISKTPCPNCGEAIWAGANYCSNCSFPLLPSVEGSSYAFGQQARSGTEGTRSIVQQLSEIDAMKMDSDLLVQVKLHLLWDRAKNRSL